MKDQIIILRKIPFLRFLREQIKFIQGLDYWMDLLRFLSTIIKSDCLQFQYYIRKITVMSADSSFSDSFQLDNIISRNTPRQIESNQNNPRSRFSILTDFTQANQAGKKIQEQSLLSKYLKDLHEQENDRPFSNQQNIEQQSIRHEVINQNRENDRIYEREPDWRKKSGVHYVSDKLEVMSHNSSENMRESKMDSGQAKNLFLDTIGIVVYKKTIDLSKPIDLVFSEKENYQRNFGQFKNRSRKNYHDKRLQEDMLFANALNKQKNIRN